MAAATSNPFGESFVNDLGDALPQNTCAKCNRSNLQEFVALEPCEHVICPQCMISRLVQWPKKFDQCTCPCDGCKAPIEAHSYERDGASSTTVPHPTPKADTNKDPFRSFKQMDPSERKDKAVFSVSYEVDGKLFVNSLVVDLETGPETEEDENKFVDLAVMMHRPLFNRSRAVDDPNASVPRLSPLEFQGFGIHEDCRLLTRFLYALVSGLGSLRVEKLNTTTAEKKFLAAFVASEVLSRANATKPGRLQMMISDLLENHPAADTVIRILSRLCLAASSSHMVKLSSTSAFDAATYKIEISPYDLTGFLFDNLGFRMKASYDQWTIFIILCGSEEHLKRLGFYQSDPSKRISRDGTEWNELIEWYEERYGQHDGHRNLAVRVVGIRKSENKYVAVSVCTHITTSMKLCLPNEDECRKMDESENYEWKCRIPRNLGMVLDSPSSNVANEDESVANDDDDSVPDMVSSPCQTAIEVPQSQQTQTLFESANMRMDNPYHADPGSKKTIVQVVHYGLRATADARKAEHHPSGEAPVQEIMVPFVADGSPVSTYNRLSDDDKVSERNMLDDVRFFPGGFHCNLEAHRMRGRLFYDIFGYFVKRWRPTTKSANWILLPGDPRDVETETVEYICAHYRCAADELSKHLGREVSPAEVDDHMWDRALKHPFCMAVLLELRFAEVSIALRDSEKSGDVGDVELFLTTMRFCLVMYTVTHATKYVRICCEFLRWWECASEAEKILFVNFFFTRKSPNGKPLWTDRSMEWVMKSLRTFLGKHARRGHEAKMHRVVPSVPWRVKRKLATRHLADLSDSSSPPWNEQAVPVSKVYVKTYLCLIDDKIYATAAAPVCRVSRDANIFCLPDGSEMDTSLLCAFSTGVERALGYFIHWYMITQNEETHSEDVVPLTLLKCRAGQSSEDWNLRLKAQLETDPTTLKEDSTMKKLLTKEEIQKELVWLRDDFYPELPHTSMSMKRPQLVDILCEYRKAYFEDFPEAKEGYESHFQSLVIEETTSLAKDREEELEQGIFKLDSDVKAKFGAVVQRNTLTI